MSTCIHLANSASHSVRRGRNLGEAAATRSRSILGKPGVVSRRIASSRDSSRRARMKSPVPRKGGRVASWSGGSRSTRKFFASPNGAKQRGSRRASRIPMRDRRSPRNILSTQPTRNLLTSAHTYVSHQHAYNIRVINVWLPLFAPLPSLAALLAFLAPRRVTPRDFESSVREHFSVPPLRLPLLPPFSRPLSFALFLSPSFSRPLYLALLFPPFSRAPFI